VRSTVVPHPSGGCDELPWASFVNAVLGDAKDGAVEWNGMYAYVYYWLVVWNMNFMTFHILRIIIPTD